MALALGLVLLSGLATGAVALPHSALVKGPRAEFESSGGGAEEPVRGMVKVLQLDPRSLAQSGLFRRGLTPRRVPSLSSRLPFPAFLSRGRPAQAPSSRTRVSPLNHLSPSEMDVKRRQGLQMWQRAIDRGEPASLSLSLPVQLKEAKQTCAAVPFVQRVTAPGCSTVTVHNRLCFGQCSSLFLPPEAEFPASPAAATSPLLRHRAPCSRCAPSKARTVAVPLLCSGGRVQQKRALVVEECKCETSREERSAETAAAASELL